MDCVKDSAKETDLGRETGEVESLRSARQARSVVDAISAAKAKLEDAGEDFSTPPPLPEMKSQDRQCLHRPRTLTVPMWILVIATALQALFVFTSPLHLGRYSAVHSWAEIILGISYITLGTSVVAVCVWIVARNSLLRKSQR